MMQPSQAEVIRMIDAAAGRRPGDLLLRHARVLNVFSGDVEQADVLLAGRYIAAVAPAGTTAHQANIEIDLCGSPLAPGLIDGHVHLESSLVAPREYARAVVPRGVTAVVCDPHEIANVAGLAGVEYVLAATAELPLDVFVSASSCVPATALETAGAALGLDDIANVLRHPRVVGVAELMNYPALVAGDATEVAKALLAEECGKVADGHAPGLRGAGLNAYLAAGISSDHESTTLAEAREKLRLGATVLIREGSAARNLDALLPLITPETVHRICFCTDDRHPHDLLTTGAVDDLVRQAIARDVPPVQAVRLATWNTARHFRLGRRGAVAPGYLADLVVLDDLTACQATLVFKSGQLVARDGALLVDLPDYDAPELRSTVRLPELTPASIVLAHAGGNVRVIELVPGEILTRAATALPRVEAGQVLASPEQDLAKLVVVERHGRSRAGVSASGAGGAAGAGSAGAGGRPGVGIGLVRGFRLQRGAIASTVGHDSHNLLIAGVDDADILLAASCSAAMDGGFCVVAGGRVRARLPLPIGGLMSPAPLHQVRQELDHLEQAARGLGITLPSPFMTLSFLALPVIPELRLTDQGLVTVGPDGLRQVSFALAGHH